MVCSTLGEFAAEVRQAGGFGFVGLVTLVMSPAAVPGVQTPLTSVATLIWL